MICPDEYDDWVDELYEDLMYDDNSYDEPDESDEDVLLEHEKSKDLLGKPVVLKQRGGGKITKTFKIEDSNKKLSHELIKVIYTYLKKDNKIRVPGEFEGIVIIAPNSSNHTAMIQVTVPLSSELKESWSPDFPILQPLRAEDWGMKKCEIIK